MKDQLSLFPEPSLDDVPEEIREDMNIIMGNVLAPGSEELDGPPPELPQNDIMNALAGGQSVRGSGQPSGVDDSHKDFIKQGLLKKTDKVHKFQRSEEYNVKVFDAADPEDQQRMQLIYMMLSDHRNGMTGSETPPQFIIDPTSPRGYRVLVLMKYWKVVQDMVMTKLPGQ